MKSTLIFLLLTGFISSKSILLSQSTDFSAYYTRLAYNENNNTGKYADIVVNINNTGRLVFSREYSYLPYWEAKSSKQFFQSIIPIKGWPTGIETISFVPAKL